MIKRFKRTGLFLLGILLVIVVIVIALFWNELRSLRSLKKVDDYGMFQMTYYGDYGFDDFLKVGATSDIDIKIYKSKYKVCI